MSPEAHLLALSLVATTVGGGGNLEVRVWCDLSSAACLPCDKEPPLFCILAIVKLLCIGS